MLTKDEKLFLDYWEANRLRKKRVWRNLSVGLPLGVFLVIAIFINFFSGWYTRADMKIRANNSGFIVLVIAAAAIVVFTTVFSAKLRWDQNEQRYKEFLAKKDEP